MNLIKNGLKRVFNNFGTYLLSSSSFASRSYLSSKVSLLNIDSYQRNVFPYISSSITPLFTQSRYYKVKTRLRKRCRGCYFIWRNGRLYVECSAHLRHKQHHKTSMLKGYESIANGYDPKAITISK
jgi:ribosomal protein L36